MVTQNDLTGQLQGFPIEVVEKMLEYQVSQGNPRNVSVFQTRNSTGYGYGGFTWENTIEGYSVWNDIIEHRRFDIFFRLYPDRIQEYPKVMMVWNQSKEDAVPRVVQFFIKNRYYAWTYATNEEDAENVINLVNWNHAEDPLTFNNNN